MQQITINDFLQLLADGKQEELKSAINDILDTSHDLELISTAAHYLQQAGLTDYALKLTDKALKQQADFLPSIITQGSIARINNNFSLAKACYQKALTIDDKCISAHYNLGVLAETEGNNAAAIQHYKDLLEIDAKHMHAKLRTGICLQKTQLHAEALSLFKELDKTYPNSASIKYHLGLALQQDKQLAAASEALSSALLIEADHIDAQHALATIYSEQNQHELAISAFLQVLKLNPQHQEALHNLASIYYFKSNYKQALDAWLKLLSSQPDKFTNYNIGSCYLALQRHDEAVPYLQAACKDLPDSTDPIINLASVYIKTAEWDKVIALYQHALTINPDSHEIQYVLAAIKQTNNQFTKAPEDYVTHLFDHYADTFEDHLIDNLAYKAHIVIAKELKNISDGSKYKILDLGCGTGLCGKTCHEYASQLVGVDLSSKMLAKAESLEIYSELHRADIDAYLSQAQCFDIIIAADVMPYFGDLEHTLGLVQQKLEAGGYFIFTIENSDSSEAYSLSESGRYQHNSEMLRRQLQQNWQIIQDKAVTTRTQNFQPVKSQLFVVRKPVL